MRAFSWRGETGRRCLNLCRVLVLSLLSTGAFAQDLNWPQEITVSEGTIVIYQPQPEKLEGDKLSGRAAMSLEMNNLDEPIFGTFWFTARLETDKDEDKALMYDFEVISVRWPESKDANEQRFSAVVEAAIPNTGLSFSLERLSASLATAEVEQRSLAELKNDPPIIVFREQPAVLLTYDGDPRYQEIEGSSYQRVMNTPFVVVRDKNSRYFLSSGTFWYEAKSAMGPWTPIDSPPADLAKMITPPEDTPAATGQPPEVVVATEPTELIATQGKPNWDSLTGGEVLYVSNTESPWLRDLPTGNMYVLLSGRWFRSKSTDGPWTFVPPDELPSGFENIPPASDIGGLRTSVAGTPEAEEAVLDAQIPQTAAINKSDASLEIQYDGEPKFEKISGTKVSYAVNTPAQVLMIDNRYYAVDNAVWFTAAKATGPWTIADEVPEAEIAEIPPSSPVYNTTHVHIYESTPQVVYVGYTPGYMWSYPYMGVPVYGTGWRYRPVMGPYYYPRPPTWGFNVGYNPWTGWNFGVSWSNGFFSMGVSFGGGWGHSNRYGYRGNGWYGGGYRGPTIINTGDINIGNTVNVGNRTNVGNQLNSNRNNINRNSMKKTNLYNRPENKGRNADRSTVQRDLQRAKSNPNRKNNVYTDKNGKVARKENGNWQTRQDGSWKNDPSLNKDTRQAATKQVQKPATKPTTQQAKQKTQQPKQQTSQAKQQSKQTSSYNRQSDLNRANRARQSGAAREHRSAAQRSGGARRR